MPSPTLLALETSTERLSVAVLSPRGLVSRDVDAGQRHSELALPLVHELMAAAGAGFGDLTAIAFGQGPGSFTGVRIACGLTQGLAYGAGLPVVPVPTQMALAEQCGADHVLVALDARMNEIYVAAYARDEGWREVVAPMLAAPDGLPPLPGTWTGIGSAFDVPALASALRARYGAALRDIVPGALPRAADVAAIAARRLAADPAAALPPHLAAPLYLRNKVAMTIAERAAHHAAKVGA